MQENHYVIDFKGYWPITRAAVADHAGLYCIFADISPTRARLLYIGETDHIEHRINHHNRKEHWKIEADGCPLYFTVYALDKAADREQVEAALINELQPPCNEYYKTGFPFPETKIKVTGPVYILEKYFTVYPK